MVKKQPQSLPTLANLEATCASLQDSPRIDGWPSMTAASNRSASNEAAHLTDAVTGIKRGKKGYLKAGNSVARFEEAL